MVATLELHKDHATLIRATPAILEQLPEFRLQFIGDGSLRSTLTALTAELGVSEHIDFLGTRHDVAEHLGRADAFVLSTSPQEGLGTVIIEALAAGLPVIASDVPACREILQEGLWGTLVEPANPSAIAKAVVEQLKSLPLSEEAREARVSFALQFTPERMINEYLTLAGLS